MFDLFRSRDKAVRILLGVILGVVAISMVTYLIPGAGGGMQAGTDDNVIAKIGDEKLTSTTALAAVQNMMQSRQIPATMMGYFAPQVVESLINERAQAYEAKRLGIDVSDDEVATAVRKQLPPAFLNKDGSVNQDAVGQALSQKNLTIPQWIEETRESIMAERLRSLVEASVVVTKADLQAEYKQRNEKVKINYVLVKPAMLEQEVQVSPADVDAYFKAHRQMYQTAEKRSLAIILLDPAKVEATINPSDADLQSAYNSGLDRFRTPEQVQVRHILIPIDATTTDAVAQAKAADVLKQLKAGGDFGELAKKYSKDPGLGAEGRRTGNCFEGTDGEAVRRGRVQHESRGVERAGENDVRVSHSAGGIEVGRAGEAFRRSEGYAGDGVQEAQVGGDDAAIGGQGGGGSQERSDASG